MALGSIEQIVLSSMVLFCYFITSSSTVDSALSGIKLYQL